jgi:uncharacterized protein (TIRG00374 family)
MSYPNTPTKPRIILLLLILGALSFAVYIFFFVDTTQVLNTLSKTNLVIYSGAFFTYILYTLCSSFVWYNLLRNLSIKITKRKAFLYTWVGLFFDATIPQVGWSAEVTKTYLLAKDANVDTGRIGASVVGQKLFTIIMTIFGLSAGLFLVLFRYSLRLEVAAFIGLVLFSSLLTLAFIYYVSLKPHATKTLLDWAIKAALFFRKSWNPQNFRVKAQEMLAKFHTSMKLLKANPKTLVSPIIFSIIGFTFEVSVVFFAFAALGQPLPIDVVLVVFTLTGTLQTVGVAFFGFPELVMTLTLEGLGIDVAVAISVALLTRIVNLWFRLVVSYIALQWAGINFIFLTKHPKDSKKISK